MIRQRCLNLVRRRRNGGLTYLVSLILLVVIGAPVLAQGGSYTIPHFTINSGGGLSSGGGFTLISTIGRPDASTAMTDEASQYALTGGFWPAGTTINIDPGPGDDTKNVYLPLILRE